MKKFSTEYANEKYQNIHKNKPLTAMPDCQLSILQIREGK